MKTMSRWCAAMLLGAMAFAAQAQQTSTLGDAPEEKSQGSVKYRAGGIGEESLPLRMLRPKYALSVALSQQEDGQSVWASGVNVKITNAVGESVLKLDDTGPLVLAQVPPGKYHVAATFHVTESGQKVDKDIASDATVEAGKPTFLSLEWPAAPVPPKTPATTKKR